MKSEKNRRLKSIFTNFIIFHLIALIILWGILLFIFFIKSDYRSFLVYVFYNFFSEIKLWESILLMLVSYFFVASWWVEWIRKGLIGRANNSYLPTSNKYDKDDDCDIEEERHKTKREMEEMKEETKRAIRKERARAEEEQRKKERGNFIKVNRQI
jgi:hypothetical protein